MVINTNTTALSSARLLSDSSNMLSKSLQRLSSGSKIVSPEDDPAGCTDLRVHAVAVSERDGGKPETGSRLHELLRVACSLQEREVGLAPQGNVHG